MEDFMDPLDYVESDDYQDYEDKYADELDEIADFEEPDIDFDIISTLKNKNKNNSSKLDGNLLNGSDININFDSITTNNEHASNNQGSKRNFHEMDNDNNNTFNELKKYDEFEEFAEKLSPKNLKPKKLKLDDQIPDWLFESSTSNHIKDKHTDIIQKLKHDVSNNDSIDETAYNASRRRVFSRPVFGIESLNVTSTEGDRVFLKLCSEKDIPKVENQRWQSNSSESGLNLLSVPFHQLKKEVEEKRHAQMMEKAASMLEKTKSNNQKEIKTAELWVEKYAPKRYTELLSDDGTNRFLLKWLKLWDEIVFGTKENYAHKHKNEAKTDVEKMKDGKFSKIDNNNMKFQKKYYDPEDDLIKDSKKRPKKKLALLCGDPGLGKTTLAHVISQHAGYNVVEMNASDDRSPEVFLNKIEMSTQMKAVMGQTKRPNCLVIDEIDGAPVQAINILLELVKVTESSGGKLKKKRKKKEIILNRPIICICNDQFVPALRQLRQVAFTLRFPSTVPSRLAGRLLTISQSENVRIDMGSLLLLADKAENDIRSCLNTLQFIQQKIKAFKPEDLRNLDIGQKDMKKGVRVILGEVFQLPRANKKKFSGKSGKDSKTSLSSRFHYMLHLISGFSEFEKMSQGLFDQYLNTKSKDPYLESINLGNDWLIFTDTIQKKISHDQDYAFWKYLSFLPVAFHMFFARTSPGKIPYSNVGYENHLKLTHNIQTIELMTNGMSPSLRRYCSSSVITSDLIPYLFLISSPSLRPVNTKLYSESEKQMYLSLINTMIAYNLTYHQERDPEGQYTYLLEPNIEELTTFTGLPQHRHLPYATKQLIAREVEMEKMRQAEKIMKAADEVNETNSKETSSKQSAGKSVVPVKSLAPKKIVKFSEREHTDFFGRIIKTSSTKQFIVKTKELEKLSILSTSTRFLFNEGYTNAVRRTTKINDFL